MQTQWLRERFEEREGYKGTLGYIVGEMESVRIINTVGRQTVDSMVGTLKRVHAPHAKNGCLQSFRRWRKFHSRSLLSGSLLPWQEARKGWEGGCVATHTALMETHFPWKSIISRFTMPQQGVS